MRSAGLSLIVVLTVVGCTDVDIYFPIDPDSPQMRIDITSRVCAPPAVEEDAPYKILFVADTSLSNLFSDPAENRVTAYHNAIAQFADKETVSFALITFSDQPHLPMLAYTRDADILAAVGEKLTNEFAEGGTNYSDTLGAIYNFINNDINASLAAGTGHLVAKTHYLVYWLSDGMPTHGISDPMTLANSVQTIHEHLSPRVAEFRLDTLYMEPPLVMDVGLRHWEITEEEIEESRGLLELMAGRSEGNFTAIEEGHRFDFDIQLEKDTRVFEIATAVAFNRNARLKGELPRGDSDADGVIDDDERDLGLDPTLADTDGDGYRDGVELQSTYSLNPDRFDSGCESGQVDQDADGLWDCEEAVMDTDPFDPDTDGDDLLDGMELLFGTSPLSDDPVADADLDGVADRAEVILHLEPARFDTPEEQERWGYRYVAKEVPAAGDGSATCYDLTVENVSMARTMETAEHPRGGQNLELVIAFTTGDEWPAKRFYRAQQRIAFVWPDIRTPANGNVVYPRNDFYVLPVFDNNGEPIGGDHLNGEYDDSPFDGLVPERPSLEDDPAVAESADSQASRERPTAGFERPDVDGLFLVDADDSPPLAPASTPLVAAAGEVDPSATTAEWSGGCRATTGRAAWGFVFGLALAARRRRRSRLGSP